MSRVSFFLAVALSFAVASAVADAPLPTLGVPIEVDGKLDEWREAPTVPILSSAQTGKRSPEHLWKGPLDAGAEFMCGWTSQGLCLAARVTDDDVCLPPDLNASWHCDSLELLIDGRPKPAFRSGAYSAGAYQLFILPPSDGKKPTSVLMRYGTAIEGLKAATTRTEHGWNAEVLIPWNAFPGFAPVPGTPVGLSFVLNEYDRRDGKVTQPLALRQYAESNRYHNPSLFTTWRLAEANATAMGARSTGPEVVMHAPSVVESGRPYVVEAVIGSALSGTIDKIRVSLIGAGSELAKREMKLNPMQVPWEGCFTGSVDLQPHGGHTGEAKATLEVIGKQGDVLGKVEREVALLPFNTETLRALVDNSRIQQTAETDPLRLRLWAGVAMSLENCKEAMSASNPALATQFEREVKARSEVLEAKAPSCGNDDLLQLLQLESDAASQVTVQVVEQDRAQVGFYSGAFPLAGVYVHDCPTTAAAMGALANSQGGQLGAPSEETTVSAMPGRISVKQFVSSPILTTDFRPDRELLLVDGGADCATVLSPEEISVVKADVAAVVPGCPVAMRAAVEKWAQARRVAVLPADQPLSQTRVLMAGDIRTTAIVLKVPRYLKRAKIADGPVSLAARSGRRVYTCTAASREIAELAISLVHNGKAVTEQEADRLRQLTVDALTKKGSSKPAPAGTSLFVGDVHSHSKYSDGRISPVAMLLLATYSNSDFHVLSDHNTIEGAVAADRLMKKHSYVFPWIIGEEVTISGSDAHVNVYPLSTQLKATSPLSDTFEAAKQQGAIAQWNHPGYPTSDWAWAQMPKRLEGTRFDAWEHLPWDSYDEWKTQGPVPQMVGSTDTHNTTLWGLDRTVVLAPECNGNEVAKAIRAKKAGLWNASSRDLFYGSDEMAGYIAAALADGKTLKMRKAAALQAAMRQADMSGLIRDSKPGRQ